MSEGTDWRKAGRSNQGPARNRIEGVTAIGKRLIELFEIYDIDLLREDYSATVDMPHMSDAHIKHLEGLGFEVIHEEASIYTLRYNYEC